MSITDGKVITEKPDSETLTGLSLINYPTGSELVTWCHENKRNRSGKQREAETKDQMAPEVQAAAISRAKRVIRQKALTINASILMTLTYRGAMKDFDKLWNDFKLLLKRLRREGIKFHYLAVAERHKSGGFHLHVTIPNRVPVAIVRKHWYGVTGEVDGKNGGQVNLEPNKKVKGKNKSLRIAGYLCKYISKSLDDVDISRKRYRTSIGIKVDKAIGYFNKDIVERNWFLSSPKITMIKRFFAEHIGIDFLREFEYREGQYFLSTYSDEIHIQKLAQMSPT